MQLRQMNQGMGWMETAYVQDMGYANAQVLVETRTGAGYAAPEATVHTYGLERLLSRTALEEGVRKAAYVYGGRTSVAQRVVWEETGGWARTPGMQDNVFRVAPEVSAPVVEAMAYRPYGEQIAAVREAGAGQGPGSGFAFMREASAEDGAGARRADQAGQPDRPGPPIHLCPDPTKPERILVQWGAL